MSSDKQKHLLAGLALSLLAGLLYTPKVGFATWDWLLKKGTPEPLDFVATVAGGVIGYLLLKLI